MSKQMACQLTGAQIVEWGKVILELAKIHGDKYDNFGDLLDAEEPDAKKRGRLGTALVVLDTLEKDRMSVLDIQRVIRWRNEDGKPGGIEIHYNKSGKEKRAIKLSRDRMTMGLLTFGGLLQRADIR